VAVIRPTGAVPMMAFPLSRSTNVTAAFRISPADTSPAASLVAEMSLMVALSVTVAWPALVLAVVVYSVPE
jgi:hypothetical protein